MSKGESPYLGEMSIPSETPVCVCDRENQGVGRGSVLFWACFVRKLHGKGRRIIRCLNEVSRRFREVMRWIVFRPLVSIQRHGRGPDCHLRQDSGKLAPADARCRYLR